MDPTNSTPSPPEADPSPDPVPPDILPASPPAFSRDTGESPGIGELIAGTIGGLILFGVAGGIAVSALRNQTALTFYLMFCGVAGVSCCFKPALRGLGIGILLGLGGALLLLAICSGMRF